MSYPDVHDDYIELDLLCPHGWTNQFIDCPKCEYEAEIRAESELENQSSQKNQRGITT